MTKQRLPLLTVWLSLTSTSVTIPETRRDLHHSSAGGGERQQNASVAGSRVPAHTVPRYRLRSQRHDEHDGCAAIR